MPTSTIYLLIKQLFKKKATNPFPLKRAPDDMTSAAESVEKGELELNPPVEIPKDFRGKIRYDKECCIGCKMCVRVCPSEALIFKEEEEKVKHYVSRCTFCGQCVNICPVSCFEFSEEFLIAGRDKNAEDMIINP